MIIENTEVTGWKAAIRGMRNPMNSWAKSDSLFEPELILGPNDLDLTFSLIKGGAEHRKLLRMIHVSFDLTFPIYGWSEFDTYKIGVTRNSCSTMHKLGSRDLTVDDFEEKEVLPEVLTLLNTLGAVYRRDKDFALVRKMKMHLPASFLQKATIDMNYEVAMNMYYQRKTHRLPIWSGPNGVDSWIRSLPYMNMWLSLKD
jgi:hypothetical protein